MTILITGACGFVGSALSLALRERREGLEITGVDNFLRPGSEVNRTRLARAGVRVVHGDVRMTSDWQNLPPADWVIEAAANPSVLGGIDGRGSARQLLEQNLWGGVESLEYCRSHGAGLVVLSSSRVYSIQALAKAPLSERGEAFALDETAELPEGLSGKGIGVSFSTEPPLSLYGASKRAFELLALEYGGAFGIPVWVNRCGVMAGAGQFGTADQGIFSFWIHAHARRAPLRYLGFGGSGYQVRDALHPRDLAGLIEAQIEQGRTGGPRTYTLGGGASNAMSLRQLTLWCDSRFGRHAVESDGRERPFDLPWVVMDSAAAERDFRWRRETAMEDILNEIAGHAEANPQWLELSGWRA